MSDEDATANLTEALVAFQAEMPVVAKTHRAEVAMNGGGKYAYTYADLADVSAAAMPLLTRHGLAFSCCPQVGPHGGYELRGTLLHVSGERLEGSLPIGGNSPQQIGSALTYARRYLFGCMTGLVTDDDDDGKLAQGPTAAAQAPAGTRRQPDPDRPVTAKTRGQMFALFGQKGIAEDQQLAGINKITGKAYESRADVSEGDAKAVIAVLKNRPDAAAPAPEPGAADEAQPAPDTGQRLTALFDEIGLTDEPDRLAYAAKVVGRPIASTVDLTDADLDQVIAAIEADVADPFRKDSGEPS